MATRKCKVCTNDGQHIDVDCDGFSLLDNGFVILKRIVPATSEAPASEKTVAIFDRPTAVILEDDGVPPPSTPGSQLVASG